MKTRFYILQQPGEKPFQGKYMIVLRRIHSLQIYFGSGHYIPGKGSTDTSILAEYCWKIARLVILLKNPKIWSQFQEFQLCSPNKYLSMTVADPVHKMVIMSKFYLAGCPIWWAHALPTCLIQINWKANVSWIMCEWVIGPSIPKII